MIRTSGKIGFVLVTLGGVTLDSQGKAYYVALALVIAGLICLACNLRNILRTEKNRQERELQRTIDRYLRDYRGVS